MEIKWFFVKNVINFILFFIYLLCFKYSIQTDSAANWFSDNFDMRFCFLHSFLKYKNSWFLKICFWHFLICIFYFKNYSPLLDLHMHIGIVHKWRYAKNGIFYPLFYLHHKITLILLKSCPYGVTVRRYTLEVTGSILPLTTRAKSDAFR